MSVEDVPILKTTVSSGEKYRGWAPAGQRQGYAGGHRRNTPASKRVESTQIESARADAIKEAAPQGGVFGEAIHALTKNELPNLTGILLTLSGLVLI